VAGLPGVPSGSSARRPSSALRLLQLRQSGEDAVTPTSFFKSKHRWSLGLRSSQETAITSLARLGHRHGQVRLRRRLAFTEDAGS
jgi:hypothetical protein